MTKTKYVQDLEKGKKGKQTHKQQKELMMHHQCKSSATKYINCKGA